MAAMLAKPTTAASAEKGKKKKKQRGEKKVPQEEQRDGEKVPDLVKATSEGVICLDESSPQRGDGADQGVMSALPSMDLVVRVDETREAAPTDPLTREMDVEPTDLNESAAEPDFCRSPPCSSSRVPFLHNVSEMGKQHWKELRARLIGELQEGYSPVEDPAEDERFVPSRFLYKEDSVFLSGRSQATAIRQFSLPRDLELLKDVPSSGLRLSLQSYHTRAALASEELYKRLHLLNQVRLELEGELAEEKRVSEAERKKASALEVELGVINSKWELELEKKQATISQLQTHYAKQSAVVANLKEEVARHKKAAEATQLEAANFRKAVEASQKEIADRDERVRSLEAELEAERREKLSAQAEVSGLKAELDNLRVSHQTALADFQSHKARLDHLTSEEGRKEIIDDYRLGPFGKAELTLAVKAGCDYLRAQLPRGDESSPAPAYPPLVEKSLAMLLELERKGVGIRLDVDESAEDDGEDDDEDDGGDGSGDDGSS